MVKQVPPTVEFAMNVVVSQLTFHADRHVETDMPVAGMQFHIGGKSFGQLHRDAPVAGMKIPARTDGRSGQGTRFDAAVTAAELQRVEPSGYLDVAVARVSFKRAVDSLNFHRAIARLQIHVALQICQPDGAIAAAQIHTSLARHVDFDIHSMIARCEYRQCKWCAGDELPARPSLRFDDPPL